MLFKYALKRNIEFWSRSRTNESYEENKRTRRDIADLIP